MRLGGAPSKGAMSKSEHRYWALPQGELTITTRHEDRSFAAHLSQGRAKLRLSVYPLSERVSLGVRVRIDRHADEEVTAGLYLGPVHLHAGVHHPLRTMPRGPTRRHHERSRWRNGWRACSMTSTRARTWRGKVPRAAPIGCSHDEPEDPIR